MTETTPSNDRTNTMQNHPNYDSNWASHLARVIARSHSRPVHEDDVDAACKVVDVLRYILADEPCSKMPLVLAELFTGELPESFEVAMSKLPS